jgi:hypothetical protein
MNPVVVMLLLALLEQPGVAQKESAQKPCSGPELVGTWQLVESGGSPVPAGESTSLKHVTPTHFFVLSADEKGVASYGHGGPYTVSAGTYTESIAHGFGEPFTQLRGMKVSFKCSIEAEAWHNVGEIAGQTFDERWKRVRVAPER